MIVHSQERLSRKPSPLFPSLIEGGKLGEQLRTFPIHSPVKTNKKFILSLPDFFDSKVYLYPILREKSVSLPYFEG